MEGIVIFVFIGLSVLVMLGVIWYLFQTVRIMWAYNSFLAIVSIVFSPIVHIIFYFIPKDNFDKHEAGLFKKYFLFIGLLALIGIASAIVIPATTNSQKKFSSNEMVSLNADEIENLAIKGNAEAQARLATMYYSGEYGLVQDYVKAAEWSRKAADQGYAHGQLLLGWLYEEGNGVDKDYAEAAKWHRKGAEQGYASSQFSLGIMYEGGQGVPQDYAKAIEWYKKAADQGEEHSQFRLGVMYDQGDGVRQDYAKAVEWYKKAADQGNAKAQILLGGMYEKGNGVRQDYAEAKEWFGKSCDNGLQYGCDKYREHN